MASKDNTVNDLFTFFGEMSIAENKNLGRYFQQEYRDKVNKEEQGLW